MDKNTTDLFKKLKKFELTSAEARALAKIVKKCIKTLCPTIRSQDEDFINFFLDYATNVPFLYNEHLEHKKMFLSAREALLQKGTDKTRMTAALAAFGLKLKAERNSLKLNLKSNYESLFQKTTEIDKTPNTKKVLHYGSLDFDYVIEWHNLASRKKAIIKCLSQKYKDHFASAEAITKQLRRLKTQNLP